MTRVEDGPTRIDGDSFAAALQDGHARALARKGVEYLEQLQREGREHSLPALQRHAREWEVVSCFDCGFTGNRVDESHDSGPSGIPYVDHLCPECGESCGPWIRVREVLETDAADRDS